ncbi:MAG: GPW/gp25 family protein [Actinomycetota bacterium]|nr:GPW/gp25 family protein [Actinomycetota bacterium]
MTLDLAFPYRLGPGGTTATAVSTDAHIAQMLEQLLFTRPGERVNHPDFGCGLLDLVFSPASPEVAAALSITVSAAVQRWLGDVVKLQAIDVTADASVLKVLLSYVVLSSGVASTATFSVPLG